MREDQRPERRMLWARLAAGIRPCSAGPDFEKNNEGERQ